MNSTSTLRRIMRSEGLLKTAGSGAKNKAYLDSLDSRRKDKILKGIATHYGTTVEVIEGEVTGPDAEALYEYITAPYRMKVYREMRGQKSARTARRPYRSERDDIDEQYDDVPRNEQGALLPTMRDLKKVKMVVVGPRGRYAAPELNREGKRIFKEITGSDYDSHGGKHGTPRHHPALVWIAQTNPGLFADGFELVSVPGGVYKIREYDGSEWLETPQSVEWTKI